MINFFIDHPTKNCMTYFEHLLFSLNFSKLMVIGSVQALIHAFIPEYYKTSTTDITNKIQTLLKNGGCNKSKNE